MSNNIFNNHPLIKNSNQYFLEKKYISISSEDRDVTKYPNSSEFEIFLPQEYLNVASARLYSWSFPANYNVFSPSQYNVNMTFKLVSIYNPGEHNVSNPLLEGIFAALHDYGDRNYIITIETGFYNPDQMALELTNKFNDAVTHVISNFFADPVNAIKYAVAKDLFQNYDRFKIVYNSVAQKLWFGNNSDKFILTNDASIFVEKAITNNNCIRKNMLPEWSSWGLPSYLGFTRCNAVSYNVNEFLENTPSNSEAYTILLGKENVPRFFYGDGVPGSGDGGYWLLPTLPDATVYFLQAPFKIAFMGPSYIYMEIEGMNYIDETAPFNLSKFTATTNQTNGIVNSCFAKIPVPTTPISQWFDNSMGPYKYWNPPAERISKLKIKFRYHNGMPVEFGLFEYSFMLEFNILKPQQERSYSIVNAFELGQQQSYASRYV